MFTYMSTLLATTWLIICLLLCSYSWVAGRKWFVAGLIPSVLAAAFALWLPTGTPRFTHPPKGKYEVLYVDVQVDKAIYVLLQSGGNEGVYYVLPYSNAAANDIQEAVNEGGEGGKIKLNIDGENGEKYDGEPPVTGLPPKE